MSGPSLSGYDRLVVNGAVHLNGARLDVRLGFAPRVGQRFAVVVAQGSNPTRGTFTGLPHGARFRVGTRTPRT